MGFYGFYGFDMTYLIFIIPALLFAMYAQARVSSTFNKYKMMGNSRGLTGADVARKILDMNGLYNVRIERIAGNLTDHFDPRSNVVRLSEATHDSMSVAAIGVSAHEVGHAIQFAAGYSPIKLRNSMFPIVQISSYAAWPLAIIGLLMGAPTLTSIGIVLFTIVVAFHLVTLPVEFNASSRAIRTLGDQAILSEDELRASREVLNAAAMTYVASAAVAIGNLIRLLLLNGRRND